MGLVSRCGEDSVVWEVVLSSLLPNIITKVDQTIFDSSKVLRKIVIVAGSHLVNIMQVIQQTINVLGNNRLRRDDGGSPQGRLKALSQYRYESKDGYSEVESW
jgi:hypothetical protein